MCIYSNEVGWVEAGVNIVCTQWKVRVHSKT